jgi:hypothetical protein
LLNQVHFPEDPGNDVIADFGDTLLLVLHSHTRQEYAWDLFAFSLLLLCMPFYYWDQRTQCLIN